MGSGLRDVWTGVTSDPPGHLQVMPTVLGGSTPHSLRMALETVELLSLIPAVGGYPKNEQADSFDKREAATFELWVDSAS